MRQLCLTSKKRTTVSLVPKPHPIKEIDEPDYELLLRRFNQEQRELAIEAIREAVSVRTLAMKAASEAVRHATEVRSLESEVKDLRRRIRQMEERQ